MNFEISKANQRVKTGKCFLSFTDCKHCGIGRCRERRWVKEVYITVLPSGVSASQDAETHHEGNSPEGAELTQGREQR